MRLTAKFLLAFGLALTVVLSVTAWRNLERESALFDRDLRHDSLLVGRLVAQAYEHAEQRGDPRAMIAVLDDARNAHVGFTVTRLLRRDLPAQVAAQIAAGEPTAIRNAADLTTYVPLDQAAVLRITGSLAAEHRYIRASRRRAMVSTVAALGLGVFAVSILGVLIIGRPTKALVDKARRVGRGDFSKPLWFRQRDELGELATEINAMTDGLATARIRLEAESHARVAAVEQLRHADRLMTVGSLAAGIAHELGTPLNVIEGRARMIETGDAQGAEIADSARIVVEQSRRITAIIRQLLDFARRGNRARAQIDLLQLGLETTQLLLPAARKADVTLIGPLATNPIVTSIDDGQIMQVLTNLMINSIHATPPGGRVTIELDIVMAAGPGPSREPHRVARIRVADTGAGMDAMTRERMFEPFFTTKDVGRGTGLGLAVVHGIIADHDGWIVVDSTLGVGTTIDVHLPIIEATS
jgi:two-component system, NtrC family, sensor kinase